MSENTYNAGIVVWYSKGMYIYEKYHGLSKNIFINYSSINGWSYNELDCVETNDEETEEEFRHYKYTQSTHIIYLNNNMIIKLIYDEESHYIFDDYLKNTNNLKC